MAGSEIERARRNVERALAEAERAIERVEGMEWDCGEEVYDELLDIRYHLRIAAEGLL